MRFNDKKQKLDYLLELIAKGNTGTVEVLYIRLFVQKRSLYRYINDLRELGYEISYCRLRKTYYLINEKK